MSACVVSCDLFPARAGMPYIGEARDAGGIAPVRRGHPAYPYMRDADNDGIVCE